MTIIPLNNNVLLKPLNDNTKTKSGFSVDTSYLKVQHSSVVCEVMAVPERLIFGYSKELTQTPMNKGYVHGLSNETYELLPNSMEWETEVEVQVGDTVIIHYMGYQSAYGQEHKVIDVDGVECFLCPYEYLILAKRRVLEYEYYKQTFTNKTAEQYSLITDNNFVYKVIMLNGYILTQPIEKNIELEHLVLPETIKNVNKKVVRVCYAGNPNKRYLNPAYSDMQYNPGDIVVVDKATDIPLEYNPTFNGEEKYWRIQGNLILCKR